MKDRLLGLAVSAALTVVPLALLMPGLSVPWLILGAVSVLWLWRISRRIFAKLATRALARGDVGRAKRLYWFLRASSLDRNVRRSCRLSLAACDAFVGDYERARMRLAREDASQLESAQQAIASNLEAYCLARRERELERALDRIDRALELRPSVPGFHHTRGIVLLALGRLDESGRELEATWSKGQASALLEAERSYDLGRLWAARGYAAYARDYFERASRAHPESSWAAKARELLGTVPVEAGELESAQALEGLL